MTTDPRNSDPLPSATGSPRDLRRHVVLIGLRASGKSTVAAALAEVLSARWIDLDERTRAILGAPTVREAFVEHGESGFRAAEAAALSAALDEPPAIIALGGGTPTAPGAAYRLDAERRAGRAFVVFLDPGSDILAARLRAHEGDRPSLTGRGVVEEIEELACARRPLYAALADLRLLDDLDPASAVSIITSQVC
jgi:shikimate kinase